ncbi:hypothetical protein ACFO6R_06290 [Eubacterium multiforme]|uniref:Lipoprotein n=1 Tax=Eubacterium multiforme TaxID=83339 RepID=A0ABT9USB7_9FIRM|nr:hypothetical protein [Eubacterium multiforme]MDQ0149201.1 hypothetical protein [Eubacterium multiforme]
MKKKKLITFSIVFVIIVGIIGFFKCKLYLEKMDAHKKIDKFITEKAGISLSEILDTAPIKVMGNVGDTEKEYIKNFTTKRDLEKWKEKLKKDGKNYKDLRATECEIQYSCTYSPEVSKFKQVNVYNFYYNLYGNSINRFKEIENKFEYPPNKSMKKFLKELNTNYKD